MSFGEAIKSVFGNYAKFSGRARRSEYWYFALFNFVITTLLSSLSKVFNGSILVLPIAIIAIIYSIAILIPSLAVLCRRLHDIGKSGFWMLIWFVPIFGWIAMLIFLLTDSQESPNEYGPNPK